MVDGGDDTRDVEDFAVAVVEVVEVALVVLGPELFAPTSATVHPTSSTNNRKNAPQPMPMSFIARFLGSVGVFSPEKGNDASI